MLCPAQMLGTAVSIVAAFGFTFVAPAFPRPWRKAGAFQEVGASAPTFKVSAKRLPLALIHPRKVLDPWAVRDSSGVGISIAFQLAHLNSAPVADFLPSPPVLVKARRLRVRVPLGTNPRDHGLVLRRVRDRFRMRDA